MLNDNFVLTGLKLYVLVEIVEIIKWNKLQNTTLKLVQYYFNCR